MPQKRTGAVRRRQPRNKKTLSAVISAVLVLAAVLVYYFPELDIMFSGDTLFCQSCGRTDFPTGSGHDMMRSLERIASDIPDETEVFPGHMGFTTVADEKRFNPYMR